MWVQDGKLLLLNFSHNSLHECVKVKTEQQHFSRVVSYNKRWLWLVPDSVTHLSCQGSACTESCSPRAPFCKQKPLIKVTLMADLGAYNAPASSVGRQGAAASWGGLCCEHSAVINGSLSQPITRAPLENTSSTLAGSAPGVRERLTICSVTSKKFKGKKRYTSAKSKS